MKVSLFVTCLVDQFFPRVGFAAAELLTRGGVEVVFDAGQTCCGQPAFNAGHRAEARAVAEVTLRLLTRALQESDYVVVPSGSCATMLKKYYAELFKDDAGLGPQAERLGGRVYELSQFLVEVLGAEDAGATYRGRVTYHDSCHLLRELGVSGEPRKLLAAVRGADYVEMNGADACCGFGGVFSVKYPEISSAIAEEKVKNVERCGADTVVACDAGCLMRMAGLLSRRGSGVRCVHLAELLAAGGGE
jgi:L-lactate dehydrogenase complex protein LldE